MSERVVGKRGIPWLRCTVAGGIGIASAMLLLLLMSVFLAEQILPQGREGVAARAALLLASVAAGVLACRGVVNQKAMYAGITGGFMAFFVLFLGIFTKESSVLNMSLLLDVICIIFGVLVGAALTAKRKRRRRRRSG